MTVVVSAALFLSSYCPLLVVFALLETFGSGAPMYVCLGLAALGVLSLALLFVIDRTTAPQKLMVATASPRDSDVLGYIASYLVPFATVAAQTPRQQAAVGIFVSLIAVIYVRAELFYINPLLALLGFRIYEVQTAGGTTATLICRRRFVPPGQELRAIRLGEYVWRESHDSAA